MNAVDISVIIVVRDMADTIGQQLAALAAQQGAPAFELLVVDNGSTDGTSEVVNEFIRGDQGPIRQTRFIDGSARVGVPFARNTGALASRAPVLAYCDADDVVGPLWVQAISAAMAAGHLAVTGPVLTLGADGSFGQVMMDVVPSVPGGLLAGAPILFGWTGNLAVTKSALLRAGGFDESLPPYGNDDTEFGIRLARTGVVVAFASDMILGCRPTRGWRRRLPRMYRSGLSQAMLWLRHPEVYGTSPTLARAVLSTGRATTKALGVNGPLKGRLLHALETGSHGIGTVAGTRRWSARRGDTAPRLNSPRLIDTHPEF